jgi:putative endonuclease
MAKHHITGAKGEALAAVWLEQNGYTLLHRNWRYKNWEIDFIAYKGKRLHIIEVKTRSSQFRGHPEEAIDDKKMQYLINAAEEYMYQDTQWKQLQFDVLAITLHEDQEADYFLIEDIYL